MKRILVPFDFSPQAIEALKFAIDLAKKQGSEIFMLHAIEFPAMINSSVALEFERAYMAVNRGKATERMKGIAHRMAKGKPEEIKIETMVDFGGPIPAIEHAIKACQADLIIMGTQGASGLKEITIGSNTEKIVRRSSVPVIAIRKAVKTVDNIVLPFGPANENQNEIIESAKKLQQLYNAKLHVVFVNTPLGFQRDWQTIPALQSFAKKFNLGHCKLEVYNDMTEAEGIINYTNSLKDPMVIMGTHGRRGLSHLANGSVAENVVNHIQCPVSTLRIPA